MFVPPMSPIKTAEASGEDIAAKSPSIMCLSAHSGVFGGEDIAARPRVFLLFATFGNPNDTHRNDTAWGENMERHTEKKKDGINAGRGEPGAQLRCSTSLQLSGP